LVLGLLVGELRQGPLGSPTGVVEGPLDLADAGGVEEVVGQLDDPVGVVAVEVLDGPAHSGVQAGPAQGAELVVDALLHEGVREPVVAQGAFDLAHQAGGHRRVDEVQGLVVVDGGRRDHHVEIEIAAHDRGHAQHLVRAGVEATQAAAQDVSHSRRHGATCGGGHIVAAVAVAESTFAHQQAGQLGHEEGVSLGAGVHGGDRRRAGLGLGGLGHEAAHLGFAQAAQVDADQGRLAGQGGEQVVEGVGVSGVDVDVAVGAQQDHPVVVERRGHHVGQLERRHVGPVQVVQDDHQRALLAEAAQEPGDGVVESEPRRGGVEGRRGHQVVDQLLDLVHQLGDVTGARPEGLTHQPWVATVDDGRQHLDPGPVRRGPLRREAAAPGNHGPAPGGQGGQLLHQAGLAGTWLARDQHHPSPARLGIGHGAFENVQLGGPAHEGGDIFGRVSRADGDGGRGHRDGRSRRLALVLVLGVWRVPLQDGRLGQHLAFEAAQVGPGVEAELLAQDAPGRGDRPQSLALAAAAVQGECQQAPESLPEGVLGNQGFGLGHHGGLGAEGQIGLQAVLGGSGP